MEVVDIQYFTFPLLKQAGLIFNLRIFFIKKLILVSSASCKLAATEPLQLSLAGNKNILSMVIKNHQHEKLKSSDEKRKSSDEKRKTSDEKRKPSVGKIKTVSTKN